jgi:peptide/nickel transport system permease protein
MATETAPRSRTGGRIAEPALPGASLRDEPTALQGVSGRFGALLRVRGAALGLGVLILVLVLAVGAERIAPHEPNLQTYVDVLQPPSAAYLFGTDDLGRDVLSRIIYGSRVSLEVGLISIGLALAAGVPLGLLSGYFGGLVDDALMRVMDAIFAFPALVLALAITAALGMGLGNAMIAIGLVQVPVFARLVRGQVLTIRERDYVAAAKLLGATPTRIMRDHIWPNVTAPVIVQSSLGVTTAIITEASLSFLGVGVRPPTPSWGSMLSQGYQYLETAPWLAAASGAAIFVTVLGLNFLGDGLRALLDPRFAGRSR